MHKLTCVFDTPLTALLAERASLREYPDAALTQDELGSLLWCAQGYIDETRRTTPSVGNDSPTNIAAVVRNVEGLESGFYTYSPQQFALELSEPGDFGGDIADRLGVDFIADAPLTLIFSTDDARSLARSAVETGLAVQNLSAHAREIALGAGLVVADDSRALAGFAGLSGAQVIAAVGIGRRPGEDGDNPYTVENESRR